MIKIEHIDQITPAIAGRTDFVVAERQGYTAIDYPYASPASLDDPIRRGCRGLKFGRDGALLARPFGKFFNVGERPETLLHVMDLTKTNLVDAAAVSALAVDGG